MYVRYCRESFAPPMYLYESSLGLTGPYLMLTHLVCLCRQGQVCLVNRQGHKSCFYNQNC